MRVQDLRLGNYVMCRGALSRVTAIHEHDRIGCKKNSGIIVYNILSLYVQPIPLTEEWLERLGFEWVENKHYCNKKQWTLQVTGLRYENGDINKDETWFDGIGDYSWLPNSTKPKKMVVNTLCKGNYVCNSLIHVHQLQNLYFSLTSEELTIKD